jgi:hypothetical protein
MDKVDFFALFGIAAGLIGFIQVNVHPAEPTKGAPSPPTTLTGEVKPGAPFTVGNYSVAQGWKIAPDRDTGRFQAQLLEVKNNSNISRPAYLLLNVLDDGAPVAAISCQTMSIRPGHTQTADCVQVLGGRFTQGWDTISVQRTF